MKKRRRELRGHVKRKKLHCIILFNLTMNPDPNFFYLTGYAGYGCLVLLKDRELLFVPKMEFERARKTVKGIRVKVYRKNLWKSLRRYSRGRAIGIDFNAVTLTFLKILRKEFRRKTFVDISSVIRGLRSVKTANEIRILKKACRISDTILKKLFSGFRKFRTEKDVADFLESEARKNSCELAFQPIVASGPGAAEPHHTPQRKRLRKGFCVIDFGVKYKGYCSDTTRTVYIGKPSRKERDIYNLVLNAQKDVVGSLRPGQKCSDVYNRMIKDLGRYSRKFTHGLGHGVGVEIHELPDLKPKSNSILREGMVLTVEPGVYFDNKFGIRIEDTVLISKKPLVLTGVTKSLKML